MVALRVKRHSPLLQRVRILCYGLLLDNCLGMYCWKAPQTKEQSNKALLLEKAEETGNAFMLENHSHCV